MVKVSVCGSAHAAHQFVGEWSGVTCPLCLARKPQHCGRACTATVLSTRAGFVHVECWRAFQRSPRFLGMLKADPLPLSGRRCDHCGGCCGGQCWMRER